MSYQVKPGNIFGRIGQGFGKGLAEQIPKEVARTRLSSGLQNLAKQDLSGKNQLETLAHIWSIPGMTPEIANLAQQQIAKQAFLSRKPTGMQQPGAQPAPAIPGQPPQAKAAPEILPSGFVSPSQISEFKRNLLQPPSAGDIKNLADEFLNQGLTQDPNQAMQLANQEISQNRAAQQEKINTLRKDLDERMKLSLQGGGLGDFKDVVGEIQKALVDQGEYMALSQGMSPQQVSEKLDAIALDLGKATNNLKDTGSFWNMFRKSSTKSTELKEQRRDFEKYGFGELFDDMAASQLGITPLQAAHVLDPIKNKGIENLLSKFKDRSEKHFKTPFTLNKMKEDDLDQIIKHITPKDNLYDIEYRLREKGFDINQFKRRIQDLESEKEIALTPQQKRQQKRAVDNTFLGDLLYQSF